MVTPWDIPGVLVTLFTTHGDSYPNVPSREAVL